MYEFPSKEEMLGLSGLEFMQKILSGEILQPPISDVLNFQLDHVSDGKVIFRGAPTVSHSNPMGTIHGGWYGTVLDSCMACAVMTKVPKGSMYTTLEYKVNICRNLPKDTEVLAIGLVQHSGRSTGVAAGSLVGAMDGKTYATGSTTCMILKGL